MTISLDPIRDDFISWAESLWLEDIGALRNGDAPEPSLRSGGFNFEVHNDVSGSFRLKDVLCS